MRSRAEVKCHAHWWESCTLSCTAALQVFPCWRQAMSEYYRKLNAVAQSRYSGKLKLLGPEEKDDPYEARRSAWPLAMTMYTQFYGSLPDIKCSLQILEWGLGCQSFLCTATTHLSHLSLLATHKTVETETFFSTNIVCTADNIFTLIFLVWLYTVCWVLVPSSWQVQDARSESVHENELF